MDETWTFPELVKQVAQWLAALPAPRNGQVRAVPDERTVRYYATLGLLDRPLAMRGRTALYGAKHVAQIVAIKRFQHLGKPLSEIQQLLPGLDTATLSRLSGVPLPVERTRKPARAEFWKRGPEPAPAPEPAELPIEAEPTSAAPAPSAAPVELRVELAPNVHLTLSITDDSVAISPADLRAIRAAAAPLVAELAQRGLTTQSGGG
ncbi:MAG TPA: MerR family transcriptional regulator [Kofleriaceae bacterium]|nr:MerR family transcriptional regulator [Kofleriaceae bacterium]